MTRPTLIYFPTRGRAELARVVLAGGKAGQGAKDGRAGGIGDDSVERNSINVWI